MIEKDKRELIYNCSFLTSNVNIDILNKCNIKVNLNSDKHECSIQIKSDKTKLFSKIEVIYKVTKNELLILQAEAFNLMF